jgi:hypothetical protein
MIVLNVGRRELGKSTLALYLARKSKRVVILDPRLMFPTTDPIGDLPGDGSELFTRLRDHDREIVIQPENDLQGTTDALARMLRDWLMTAPADTSLAVVLDECGLLDLRSWDWMFRCSPRESVYLILTAHQPKDFSTTVRALADWWCVFRMTQATDLEVIEDRCGDTFAAQVGKLAPYQFALWDDTKAEMHVYLKPDVWKVPMKRAGSVTRPALPDGGSPLTSAGKALPLFGDKS